MDFREANSGNGLRIAVGALGLSLLFLFFVGEGDRLPPAPEPIAAAPATLPLPTNPVRALVVPAPEIVDESQRFTFAREGVLGTSFDLTVIAGDRQVAERVEARVLRELAKREGLISTYRVDSEISRINARPFQKGEQIDVSYSLWLLLDECEFVTRRSGGAFNAFAGDAVKLWREAAKAGRMPADEAIGRAASSSRAGFRLSSKRKEYWVQRQAVGSFDFNAIGKGYIIDKCVREAVNDFPSMRGLRLNIGGEIKVWGSSDFTGKQPWRIGVADPARPAENAAPLTELELRNLAVATSGNYARPVKIGDAQVNHILDPRTARPVEQVLSATVVAATAQRADALATALCVMRPEAGVAMVDALPDAACLIVDATGRQFRSASFAALERRTEAPAASAWPAGRLVDIHFQLVRSETRAPFHRHYVGAWVEDDIGRRVRILALWAKSADIRYVRDLEDFWRDAWIFAGGGDDSRPMRSFSRATRAPGEYTLVWDGRDDQGRPVPKGVYSIHLDVNREKGPPERRERHTHAAVTIRCGERSVAASAEDRPELRNIRVAYGPVAGGSRP